MTNKEYIDYLIVCNRVKANKLKSKHTDEIRNSDIDMIPLLKLLFDEESIDRDYGFAMYSLSILMKSLVGESAKFRDKVISEICNNYNDYVEYNLSVHSRYFYLCEIINDIGLDIKRDRDKADDKIRETRIVYNIRNESFSVCGIDYDIKTDIFDKHYLYKNEELIANEISGVVIKKNEVREIYTEYDVVNMREGQYKFVLICDIDTTLREDIIHRLQG